MRSDVGRTCINETERVSARRRDRSSLSFLACSSKDARSPLSLDAPPRATRFAVLNDPSNIFPESDDDGCGTERADGVTRRRTLVHGFPATHVLRVEVRRHTRASLVPLLGNRNARPSPAVDTRAPLEVGARKTSLSLSAQTAFVCPFAVVARHIDPRTFSVRASAHRLAPVVVRCELGRARFRRIRRSRNAMATAGMRGLNIFIQDVRNAANKEVEQERVDKELANIRKKFKKVKDMTPYDRKKCVV